MHVLEIRISKLLCFFIRFFYKSHLLKAKFWEALIVKVLGLLIEFIILSYQNYINNGNRVITPSNRNCRKKFHCCYMHVQS